MDDQIEMAVELYSYWRDRLDFWRKLAHDTLDAEIAQELDEKAAIAESEVARQAEELRGYGATISDGGIVQWPAGTI